MKKFILFTAFINLIFLNACSSNVSAPDTTNVNAPNTNTNVELANAENTNLIMPKNLRNVNVNVNQIEVTPGVNTNQKINTLPNAKPAPFDSAISTTMNKENQFLEVREFKKDPMIKKVERLQEIKKVKLYLKNGKVVEMPYDKGFMLFAGGSPQDILTAAGIKPPTAPPTLNPGKIEEATKDAIKKIPN